MRERQVEGARETRDRDRQIGREHREKEERESKCLGNVCQEKRILRKANSRES